MQQSYSWVVFVSLLFIFGHLTIQQIQAQAQIPWSEPIRLSTEGVSINGESFMVADSFGYLHIFWPEADLIDGRNTIQYTRFDGKSWSETLDIYLAPPQATITFLAPTVDQYGTLHLMWTQGNNGPVLYASAPAHDALSAWTWSQPRHLEIPAYRFKLQIDAQDVLHIVYSDFYGDQPGIYYTRSNDFGFTWSAPQWLDPDIPPDYAAPLLQFVLDEQDGLHVAWYYRDLVAESGIGKWVRYAHSLDGGDNWLFPITIDIADETVDPNEVRLPHPELAVLGDTVHIVWAGDSETHREHRISSDRGNTWGLTNRILGNLHGQGLGGQLIVDSIGQMHYFAQIRWPQGVYHTVWSGDHWLEPSIAYLIARTDAEGRSGRYHAHSVRAAVRAGNQLVVTFTDEHTGPLYAMYRTIADVPAAALLPTPQPEPTMQPQDAETVILPTPSPTASLINVAQSSAPPGNQTSLANSLWRGILPSLLLVLAMVSLRLFLVRPR